MPAADQLADQRAPGGLVAGKEKDAYLITGSANDLDHGHGSSVVEARFLTAAGLEASGRRGDVESALGTSSRRGDGQVRRQAGR